MHVNQYSTFLQVAAALSLAGWVARTPDSDTDAQFYNNNYGYQQVYQNERFHPYSNHQPFSNFSNNEGHVQFQYNLDNNQYMNYIQQNNPFAGFNFLNHEQYQSKDAQDNFRSYTELQELISWQEAFRRGDLPTPSLTNYVLPSSVQKDESLSSNRARTVSSDPFDDGYISGDASDHSPASVISSFSNIGGVDIPSSPDIENLEQSLSSSPISELSGAVGGIMGYPSVEEEDDSDFDIDHILFGKVKDSGKLKKNIFDDFDHQDLLKNPFENLKSKDEELDFVNSPFKNPSYDEFLASPNPDQIPHSSNLNSSLDDQFQMHFTNASLSDNNFLSNPLVDLNLDDISSAIIEEALAHDEESSSQISRNPPSPKSPVIPYKAASFIDRNQHYDQKIEQHFEHNYNKVKKDPDNFNDFSPKDISSYLNLQDFKPNEYSQRGSYGRRTFAPQSSLPNKVMKGKTKKQSSKMSPIWPDIPYTEDELIEMPVERFNEVIKHLDDTRQHHAKDIRRKGKNKLAARNCRKRKIDVIDTLDMGVGKLEKEKSRLLKERELLLDETQRLRKSTDWLNDYIFQHLRDSNGSPYSNTEYSLQYTADGNVYLVPSGRSSQNKPIIDV